MDQSATVNIRRLLWFRRRQQMGSHKLLLKIMGGVVLAAILVGCSTTAPALAPTMDIQQTIEVVKTQSAGTAVANITPNVCISTSTPLPTSTNTTVPTVTPTLKATNTLMPWWTKTPAQASGGCSITESSPKMNEAFNANDSFDGKWVVKNTSDAKWLANEMDIRYASGTKFQTKVDVIDMGKDVAEGDTYTVVVDMKAPSVAGTYATTWVIYKGGAIICSMPLTIVVK
jgi:hypothetical protein